MITDYQRSWSTQGPKIPANLLIRKQANSESVKTNRRGNIWANMKTKTKTKKQPSKRNTNTEIASVKLGTLESATLRSLWCARSNARRTRAGGGLQRQPCAVCMCDWGGEHHPCCLKKIKKKKMFC